MVYPALIPLDVILALLAIASGDDLMVALIALELELVLVGRHVGSHSAPYSSGSLSHGAKTESRRARRLANAQAAVGAKRVVACRRRLRNLRRRRGS